MDVFYDFAVMNVPDEATMVKMTEALQRVLFEEFQTEIYIYPRIESED